MTISSNNLEPEIYQGQFGEFTINQSDRTSVIIYRTGLTIAATSFAIATNLIFSQGATSAALQTITILLAIFSVGLGISLFSIHIYLVVLHRLLQTFWAIGSISTLVFAIKADEPLPIYIYHHPLTLLGVGFTFAALTGIYFKEAFCFNRLETKFLTVLVPFLLLGHLFNFLPNSVEQILLAAWTILFVVFVIRKAIQAIPPDIGDKSVFEYLKQQRSVNA